MRIIYLSGCVRGQNVQMMEMAATNMLQQVEAALDDQMESLNKLDEDDYSKIRANRIAEMFLFPGSPSALRIIGTQPAMTTVMSSRFQPSRA